MSMGDEHLTPRMASRPNSGESRSQSHGPLGYSQRLPSPRYPVAGDVPPDLSPLDAFAAQSRLLAQQLERCTNDGKRMSRLPPLIIESSLRQGRPGFFRSVSEQDSLFALANPPFSTGPGLKTAVEAASFRPISVHPRMSGVPQLRPYPVSSQLRVQDDEKQQTRGRRSPGLPTDLEFRREQSPGTIGSDLGRRSDVSSSNVMSRPSLESVRQQGQSPRRKQDSRSFDVRLAPPRSGFVLGSSSVRSGSLDDSDEDYSTSMGASLLSQQRTFSSSSGLSTSPISPPLRSVPRSPSAHSDISATGSVSISRPQFNFSRPISRATSDLSTGQPARQASSDSQPFLLSDDNSYNRASTHSGDFSDNSHGPAAPSYVYSRFSLPRGKMLQRNSKIFQENLPQAEFQWEQPTAPYSNVQTYNHLEFGSNPPSPSPRPSTSSLGQKSLNGVLDASRRPSDDQRRHNSDEKSPSSTKKTLLENVTMVTTDYRPRPATSTTSESTINATSSHSVTRSAEGSAEGSAEDHVAKGIELHEQGSLNESTYHLRIAARQHHPTGMLLYALACRHGWGMRPNQREGVEWLRKAADYAILEIADDEGQTKVGKSVDIVEQRTRKAQFALSIYELGVSHLNGWGIEQDKVLALRCFEIAGG